MHFYRNGNYIVCMCDSGTKIRSCDEDMFIPAFPESLDCCITQKCQQNCKFCYSECSSDGKHGDIMSYKFLDSLHPYTELAFNGNDMDHPQLMNFLLKLKDRKVFANMTVNQNQFMNNHDLIVSLYDKGLLYGIGVSYNHFDETFIERFSELRNGVLHVINGIISIDELRKLKDRSIKILILGYKYIGRGIGYMDHNSGMVEDRKLILHDSIGEIIDNNWFNVISFDNLALEQLDIKSLMSDNKWNMFYMGNDGEFTFYVDLVNGKFYRNSCSKEGYDIGDKSVEEMLNIIRERN